MKSCQYTFKLRVVLNFKGMSCFWRTAQGCRKRGKAMLLAITLNSCDKTDEQRSNWVCAGLELGKGFIYTSSSGNNSTFKHKPWGASQSSQEITALPELLVDKFENTKEIKQEWCYGGQLMWLTLGLFNTLKYGFSFIISTMSKNVNFAGEIFFIQVTFYRFNVHHANLNSGTMKIALIADYASKDSKFLRNCAVFVNFTFCSENFCKTPQPCW